jgi:hypothetical protein
MIKYSPTRYIAKNGLRSGTLPLIKTSPPERSMMEQSLLGTLKAAAVVHL